VFTACSMQCSLMTGSMPGKPASTRLTWVFGSAADLVAAPENSLEFEITWAWTSRPRMTSHLPVLPSIRFFSSIISISFRHQGEAGGALDGAAGPEHRLFIKGAADELQPQRQAAAIDAGRHRDAGQAREVHRHREHVIQIHRDRIVELLLQPE